MISTTVLDRARAAIRTPTGRLRLLCMALAVGALLSLFAPYHETAQGVVYSGMELLQADAQVHPELDSALALPAVVVLVAAVILAAALVPGRTGATILAVLSSLGAVLLLLAFLGDAVASACVLLPCSETRGGFWLAFWAVVACSIVAFVVCRREPRSAPNRA